MSLHSVIAEFIIYKKGMKTLNVNDSNEWMCVCITHITPISRQHVLSSTGSPSSSLSRSCFVPFPQMARALLTTSGERYISYPLIWRHGEAHGYPFSDWKREADRLVFSLPSPLLPHLFLLRQTLMSQTGLECTIWLKLALNVNSSCIHFLSTRITCGGHPSNGAHSQPHFFFAQPASPQRSLR